MMILNLINVIAIAMGIGTSAKNTSFNYEKKTHKNTVVNIDQTLQYSQVGNILLDDKRVDSRGQYIQYGKYLINNNQNWYNDNIMIQTTNYVRLVNDFQSNGTDIHPYSDNYTFVKIYNYYDSDITLNLTMGSYINSNKKYSYTGGAIKTEYNIDSAINQTLTTTTWSDLDNIYNEAFWYEGTESIAGASGQDLSGNHNPSISIDLITDELTINGHQQINIIFKADVNIIYDYYQTAATWENMALRNSNFHITGTINNTDQPKYVEVVNIPELMFTILTLPFSFITQAFNLTIFPDTPYSINFSNLFLTVIAIFILLWLIKHIFK